MDLDLSGKHALVCGASEGIGRAASEPGQDTALSQRTDFHCVGLHHSVAEAHLSVAADGHAAVVADGENRR